MDPKTPFHQAPHFRPVNDLFYSNSGDWPWSLIWLVPLDRMDFQVPKEQPMRPKARVREKTHPILFFQLSILLFWPRQHLNSRLLTKAKGRQTPLEHSIHTLSRQFLVTLSPLLCQRTRRGFSAIRAHGSRMETIQALQQV